MIVTGRSAEQEIEMITFKITSFAVGAGLLAALLSTDFGADVLLAIMVCFA